MSTVTGPQGVFLLAHVGDTGADWPHAVRLDRRPLTRRQRQILTFIRNYIAGYGYPPSLREIGCEVGLRSVDGVNYQLGQLAQRGLLERPAGGCRSRALRLIQGGAA